MSLSGDVHESLQPTCHVPVSQSLEVTVKRSPERVLVWGQETYGIRVRDSFCLKDYSLLRWCTMSFNFISPRFFFKQTWFSSFDDEFQKWCPRSHNMSAASNDGITFFIDITVFLYQNEIPYGSRETTITRNLSGPHSCTVTLCPWHTWFFENKLNREHNFVWSRDQLR